MPYMLRPLPSSPPPSWALPVAVEQAAVVMSTVGSPPPQRQVRNYQQGVLKYLDVEAQEGSASEGSSDEME